MLMLQYSQSSSNELLNSDRHVDHDRHLQSQPTSEGAYTMLSLKIPQILVDRDRHLHSQPSSEGAYTKEPWNNPSKEGISICNPFATLDRKKTVAPFNYNRLATFIPSLDGLFQGSFV